MPLVTSEISLSGFTPAEVWPVLADFTKYPALMDSVLAVEVQERSDTGMLTAWEVELDGAVFAWTERDEFHAPHELRFAQVEGDLETWQGSWRLEATEAGTRVTLSVEFDIGIPSMALFLDPLAEKAIEQNTVQLLGALRTALMQGPAPGSEEPPRQAALAEDR